MENPRFDGRSIVVLARSASEAFDRAPRSRFGLICRPDGLSQPLPTAPRPQRQQTECVKWRRVEYRFAVGEEVVDAVGRMGHKEQKS